MRSLTKWTVVVQMCLGLSVLADGGSTGVGNGGDTREMRQAELSPERVRQLLANNGEQLKSRILLPLLTHFLPNRVEERWVKESYQAMVDGGLHNDILYTYYDIDSPDCKNMGKAAQTQEVVRARICFDVEYLANDGNSIASIAGLALHEHAHHFGINDDGQYRLANYFKYAVISGVHLQPATRQFGQDGNGALLIEGRHIWVEDAHGTYRNSNREYARRFCQWQGYTRALSFYLRLFNTSDISDFWAFTEDRPTPTPVSRSIRSAWLFSTVTCGR